MRLFGRSANRYAMAIHFRPWEPPSVADRQPPRNTRSVFGRRGRSSLKQEWLRRTDKKRAASASTGGSAGSAPPAVQRRGERPKRPKMPTKTPPKAPPAPESADDNPNVRSQFNADKIKVIAAWVVVVLILAVLAFLMQWPEAAKKP